MKIMFICTGNICRSAMAHWLMIKKLEEKNRKDIEIYSSGIFAMQDDRSTEEAILVMEEYGVDLKKHRAILTRKSNIEQMDLILCMTNSHKYSLIQMYPQLQKNIFTLKEYLSANEDKKDMDIKDPWGYDMVTYRFCAAEIDTCLDQLIEKI